MALCRLPLPYVRAHRPARRGGPWSLSASAGSGRAGDLGGVFVGAAADLVAEPDQGVVLAADHAFLHRDDRVVGDLDVLRAYLGAAFGDVAVAKAEVIRGDL